MLQLQRDLILVNPLDKQELEAFSRIVRRQMPYHTENYIRIPQSQFEMPKHAMDFSAFIGNKFLNNNQHTIEEMLHRDSKNNFARIFKEYFIDLYKTYEILNHDGFFQNRLHDGYRKHLAANFSEIRLIGNLPYSGITLGFGTIVTQKSLGATLETNDGSTASSGSMGIGTILHLNKLPVGVIGDYYDGISQKMSGTTGNVKHAVYTDSTPGARLALLGSTAKYTSYALKTVTEFQLTSTANWVASVDDQSDSPEYYYKTQVSGDQKYKSIVYADGPPDPAGSGYSDLAPVFQMKIGHS